MIGKKVVCHPLNRNDETLVRSVEYLKCHGMGKMKNNKVVITVSDLSLIIIK